jgi:hypothetical protein
MYEHDYVPNDLDLRYLGNALKGTFTLDEEADDVQLTLELPNGQHLVSFRQPTTFDAEGDLLGHVRATVSAGLRTEINLREARWNVARDHGDNREMERLVGEISELDKKHRDLLGEDFRGVGRVSDRRRQDPDALAMDEGYISYEEMMDHHGIHEVSQVEGRPRPSEF